MKKLLRTILLIINLILTAALILSTLAGVLPPSRWVAVSLLSYGFVPLAMANVLCVVVWLCRSRWEFLISAAGLVATFPTMGLFCQVGGTQSVEPAEGQLKVMTFNTHGFNGRDDDTLMTADSGALLFLHLIDDVQPDVLCLQEFANAPHIKVTDSLVARGYKNHYGVHGANSYHPSVLFARCKIRGGKEMDKRSKFYADLEHEGRAFRVCSVHLDSYQLSDKDMEGFESLTHAKPDSNTHHLLRRFAATTRRHEKAWRRQLLPLIEETKTPLIIAGDFNDTPASYICQHLRKHLTDPFTQEGRGLSATYHGPYPAYRIDYIFHSRQWHTLAYRCIKTPISDHYPVVVTIDTTS